MNWVFFLMLALRTQFSKVSMSGSIGFALNERKYTSGSFNQIFIIRKEKKVMNMWNYNIGRCSFKEISIKLPWCFEEVSRKFPWNYNIWFGSFIQELRQFEHTLEAVSYMKLSPFSSFGPCIIETATWHLWNYIQTTFKLHSNYFQTAMALWRKFPWNCHVHM